MAAAPSRRRWRVARFDIAIDPAFDARLRAEPGIELVLSPLPKSDGDVTRALAGAHVYHVSSARNEMAKYSFVTPGLLARNPHLLAISTYGAGYDSVDVDACTKAGVIVMNQAGANRDSVAEHTLALILAVVHRLTESDHILRERRGFSREDLMGHEVKGMTLGLVGIGHVGTTVARMARVFGMEVIAADPLLDPKEIESRGARPVSFDELVSTADIVSLHCPRDASTVGLMGEAQFGRMKPGSYFISTARGGIHDETALAHALASGHLAGAGLDVWEPEPPPLDHPLLKLPNVFATYHTAGVTFEARHNIATLGSEQIVRLLRGEKPPRLVNPEAWPAFQSRFSGAGAIIR
ncbi:MAG TPA: hydroxyacid dehydrogenase [Usitatibacter sp.]|nr:hydroxyacid dehydrogenase [Usitatibacter sp.]